MDAPERELGQADILEFVKNGLDAAADLVVPWFQATMPEYYFRTHSAAEQMRHLHSIISGQVTTERQTVTLRSPDGSRITYISPGSDNAALVGVLQGLAERNIDTARIYTSKDGLLSLQSVILAPQKRADPDGPAVANALRELRRSKLAPKKLEPELKRFLAGASEDYLEKFEAARVSRHFHLAQKIWNRPCCEDVLLGLDVIRATESRITLAMTSPPTTGLILEAVKVLSRQGVTVTRAYADSFAPPNGPPDRPQDRSPIAIISFYVNVGGHALAQGSPVWKHLAGELPLVKWYARHDFEAFADEDGWSLRRVMLLQAACEFAHQFLIKANLWAFTSDNIARAVMRNRAAVARLADYFDARFDPRPSGRPAGADSKARRAAVKKAEAAALAAIETASDDTARQVLACIHRFFRHTLRTNYFLPNIYGLGFRVSSDFLADQGVELAGETPYGFFFFHGPLSQGFHVRYRDMARGGLRVVTTRTQDGFELESNRLFNEVTGLASAQQYKNKDIPEGGSKAVLLLGPGGDVTLAVKSAVDALLDCVLPGEHGPTLDGVVDYLGCEEIIYLGPDERIEPEHIVWIVERARVRGYRWPSAFMSSKPGAGINHKQYGVTSIGVIVFAEEILKALSIDPRKDAFTVKFTGGPRGDVAGNAMTILMREYGVNARIVSASDGHGAAYDPHGLDHAELARLIAGQHPITDFDPARIGSPEGFVIAADTPENARRRNALHNTARADLFIPAGGRPDTINAANWRDFLDADGRPTARAIVEGANIFISQEARDRLQDEGVLILHGSSANKTGVICSSYEILGGLVMSEAEFLEIKDRYVAEVLDILRVRARDEARLILREFKASDQQRHLTDISLDLSREINLASDKLYEMLMREAPDLATDAEFGALLFSYCPPVLVERYHDAILRKVPRRHQYALVAAFVASRIVYAEGVGWLSRTTSVRDVETVVRTYLRQEKRLAALAAEIDDCAIADRAEIVRILRTAGNKFLTKEALGLK
jgi:glutamate dehydrogenase